MPSSPWDAEGSLVFPSTDTSLHRQGQDRTVPGDAPAEAAEDGASNTPTGLPHSSITLVKLQGHEQIY